MSTQDGLASIVPSAGSVGPCDVFISVSAGRSTAQFQMESVAGVVPGQPKNSGVKARTPPRGSPFGAQPSAPQSLPDVWFAVPGDILSNDPAPDSHVSANSGSSADDASGDRGCSSSSLAGSENSVSPPCARSKPAKAKAPEKPVVRVESDVVPTNAPSPVETQSNPSLSRRLLEDKRSCRVLAGDGILP